MDKRKSCILLAFFILFLSMDAIINVQGANGNNGNGNGNGNNGNGNGNSNNGNGNGNNNNGNSNGNANNGNGNGNNNNGNGNGNGNNGNGNGNGNGSGNNGTRKINDDTTDYKVLTPAKTGEERAYCNAKGACNSKTLQCPSQCPERKPKKNKKKKGCFVDCSSKCEVTCKWRRANCNGYGSLCYDPRFVGGDGVMFYFHGSKGGNFAIVSDDNLQINAHFIGTRPQGRTRDFTWVQALAIMFDTHTIVIAAKRVSNWDDNVDALTVSWDGEAVDIATEYWRRSNVEERQVVVERTDDANSIRVTIAKVVEIDIRVRPIGEKENRVHNYQLPANDAFAHLETQFRFSNLTDLVEGVLGKTYRPDYVSPVKIGVPMPMMGGEDKYQTPSLYSPLCKVCRFRFGAIKELADQY